MVNRIVAVQCPLHAAAPDLRAACEAALPQIEGYAKTFFDAMVRFPDSDSIISRAQWSALHALAGQLEAAISKAVPRG